ncbi:MAG: hypothetical protein J6K21_00345 [Bacilli bacterium]|nr:hypothetical protein [Bacilli bacterium]
MIKSNFSYNKIKINNNKSDRTDLKKIMNKQDINQTSTLNKNNITETVNLEDLYEDATRFTNNVFSKIKTNVELNNHGILNHKTIKSINDSKNKLVSDQYHISDDIYDCDSTTLDDIYNNIVKISNVKKITSTFNDKVNIFNNTKTTLNYDGTELNYSKREKNDNVINYYAENGNLIKQVYLDSNSVTFYNVKNEGNTGIDSVNIDSDGNIVYINSNFNSKYYKLNDGSYAYFRDNDGNNKTNSNYCTVYHSDGTEETYNGNGQLTERVVKDSDSRIYYNRKEDGSIIEISNNNYTLRKYDSSGNIVYQKNEDGSATLYDDNGNVVGTEYIGSTPWSKYDNPNTIITATDSEIQVYDPDTRILTVLDYQKNLKSQYIEDGEINISYGVDGMVSNASANCILENGSFTGRTEYNSDGTYITYDNNNNARIITALNGSVTFYDENNNPIMTVNKNGEVKKY